MVQVLAEEEYEEEDFGPYVLEKELGQGAEGTVYQARKKKEPEEKVALKVSHQTVNITKPKFAEKTTPLVEASEKLDHPGIVRIQDIGIFKQRPFQELELFTGQNLEEVLDGYQKIQFGSQKQFMPAERAIDITIQIAQALGYAHEQGVSHGDIKPANILISPDDQIKITDFGLETITDQKIRNSLSVSGKIAGSVGYMSPQRQAGKEATPADDIFSLGVILYEMLGNELPTASNFEKNLSDINSSLPTRVDQIYRRMIAAEPEERYQLINLIIKDLRELKRLLDTPEKQPSFLLQKESIEKNLKESCGLIHQRLLNLYQEMKGLGKFTGQFEIQHRKKWYYYININGTNVQIDIKDGGNKYLQFRFKEANIYRPSVFGMAIPLKRNLVEKRDECFYKLFKTVIGETFFGDDRSYTTIAKGKYNQFFNQLVEMSYTNQRDNVLQVLFNLYHTPDRISDYFKKNLGISKEVLTSPDSKHF